MGSERLVVNELLAFVQYQLDVMDEDSVMQTCTSNFGEEEIRSAKTLLYASLNMIDRMPSRRRDEKGVKSLQDIITVLKETDQDDVPTFVVKDLRKLAPVTMQPVGVTRLLEDMTSLKASLADVQLKLEASQSVISDLRTEVVELRNTISVSRSHKPAPSNSQRHAEVSASPRSAESAECDTSPRARAPPASDALPRPAAATASPVTTATPKVGTSTTARTYSAAAKKPPAKQQQQTNLHREHKPAQVKTSRSGQADRDGFNKVEKKKKPSCRNQCGSALVGPESLLKPATPSTQLYVSRVHHSIKTEDVVAYIRSKTNFVLRVVMLEARHNVNFKSFVVRVPSHHLQTFTKEDFWPKGVVYRRFRGRLRNTTTQRNSSPT